MVLTIVSLHDHHIGISNGNHPHSINSALIKDGGGSENNKNCAKNGTSKNPMDRSVQGTKPCRWILPV